MDQIQKKAELDEKQVNHDQLSEKLRRDRLKYNGYMMQKMIEDNQKIDFLKDKTIKDGNNSRYRHFSLATQKQEILKDYQSFYHESKGVTGLKRQISPLKYIKKGLQSPVEV